MNQLMSGDTHQPAGAAVDLPRAAVREVGNGWFWCQIDASGRAVPDGACGGPCVSEPEAHAAARIGGCMAWPPYDPPPYTEFRRDNAEQRAETKAKLVALEAEERAEREAARAAAKAAKAKAAAARAAVVAAARAAKADAMERSRAAKADAMERSRAAKAAASARAAEKRAARAARVAAKAAAQAPQDAA